MRLRDLSDRLLHWNERLVSALASWVETYSCFWTVFIVTMLPLFWHGATVVVQYASSGVFQAVALPALAIVGVKQGVLTRRQAQEQHDAMAQMMRELHEMQAELHIRIGA